MNSSAMSSPSQDCDPFLDPLTVKIVKTVAYSLLFILTLLGNSLVIAVIYKDQKLRTITNLLIVNISISDLLIPLFAHSLRIKRIYFPRGLWPVDGVFGSITCKLAIFGKDTSIAVSVLTLELIAIQRFYKIVFPLKKSPIGSKKSCTAAIALIWLFGAVYPCSNFYSMKFIHKDSAPYCIYSWEPAFAHAQAAKVDLSVFLLAFTIIPFLLLTSLYSAIVISLHRQKTGLYLASEARQRRARKYRQVTYALVTIVVVFLVTWTPLNIYIFLSAFVWSSHRPCESRHLIFSAVFVSLSYPAINPPVYYIFNENFRKGYQDIFSCLIGCGANRKTPQKVDKPQVAAGKSISSPAVGKRLSTNGTTFSTQSSGKYPRVITDNLETQNTKL